MKLENSTEIILSDSSSKKDEKIEWRNADIVDYYENIPIEVLRSYAVTGGFEDGCDIDLAYPFISHTRSLIEAGAAYGRVINHLIRKGYEGKIYAVERSQKFCNYLLEQYANKAEIIQSDVMDFSPSYKVDAVLWMWSNIGEFPKKDQLKALEHLAFFLKPDGLMVLETISHTILPKNVTYDIESQTYIENSPYGMAYGYTPSIKEIQKYAEELGFCHIEHINYETSTHRPRILHILSKRNLSI